MAVADDSKIGSDGLLVRKSGAWAKEKLYYVARYFDIFNRGMKDRWPRRVYVDLLAGSGRCCLKEDPSVEFDGSPLLAFKADPGFTALLCVEGDAVKAAALATRLEGVNNIGRARVRQRDCNSPAAITEARELLQGSLGLIFIDTLGVTDPAFATIAAITEGSRKADLVVTLQVNEFTRNARAAMAGHPLHAPRFDRFFGTPAWRERLQAFDAGAYGAVDAADALTDFYLEQLATLGYVYSRALHRLMKNTKNAPLYRLIFASRDDRGLDFWDKVTKRPYREQQELF